jgi:tRNA(fMet)-specific endonuclease VapC
MICLDTNAVIAVLNRSSAPVRARLAAAVRRREVMAIPAVVLFELCYGAAKSANRQRASRRIADFLSGPVKVLDFEPDDAEEAGDIRAALERAGMPIGPYDVLIAGQARRRGAVLVTANLREFVRVPRLKTEDWTAA